MYELRIQEGRLYFVSVDASGQWDVEELGVVPNPPMLLFYTQISGVLGFSLVSPEQVSSGSVEKKPQYTLPCLNRYDFYIWAEAETIKVVYSTGSHVNLSRESPRPVFPLRWWRGPGISVVVTKQDAGKVKWLTTISFPHRSCE